jgi:type II secretory pathway pseudopilin PulG
LKPRTIQPGFTLLETLLAAGIAALLVSVVFGRFLALERSDRLLAARSEQAGDLQRVRLVMQRVSLNFLMSNRLPPRREPAPDTTGRTPPRPTRRESERATSDLTPRIMLDVDPRLAGLKMSRSEQPDSTFAIQRLEVVVTDSPVPTTQRDVWAFVRAGAPAPRRRRDRDEAPAVPAATRTDGATGDAAVRAAIFAEDAQGMVRAVRGALEFWPQGARTSQDRLEDLQRAMGEDPRHTPLWELWWVPLPPRGETVDDEPPPEALAHVGEPYRIASNIRFARWTAFDDREKKVRLLAARRQELPAYIELEIETGAGITVHWMFEADGAVGAESPPRQTPTPELEAKEAARGGADAGSGSGTNTKGGGK